MKRFSRLTVLLLCGLLLFGCGDRTSSTNATDPAATVLPDAAQRTPEPTARNDAALATEAPTDVGQPAGISLSWAKAFRISTLPEGFITPDEIAFYSVDANKKETIVNVPKEEVFAYRPERLPRTRTLEQYIPDNLDTLLVTLDYALAHGYSRFSIPTTEFTYADILGVHDYINRIYWIDGKGINSLDVQSFETEEGETLTYVLVAVSGLPNYQTTKKYLEGVAAAERIVNSIPEGGTEFQTALYLYRYLTGNVEYDYDSYYENGKAILLYDALVMHKTVCAGYTEALYYLYNLAGIDCVIIGGYISDPNPRGSHVWNIARIDGQYYQFDSTWDAGLKPSFYRYFAVSDEYMMSHHTQYVEAFSLEFAPECPESLFPEMTMFDTTTEWTERMYCTFYYYRLLESREKDPMDFLFIFGIDPTQFGGREKDGWVITNLQYGIFRTLLNLLLEDAESDRFCEGYYEERDGMLAYRKPDGQPVGWRVCEMTETEDGDVLTVAYFIDETGAAQRFEHLIRFNGNLIGAMTLK